MINHLVCHKAPVTRGVTTGHPKATAAIFDYRLSTGCIFLVRADLG